MQKELQQLGLSEKEARIYSALTGLGTVTIGALERKTGIHKQMLYPLLEKLEHEGLVVVELRNGRKQFSITDPEVLLARVDAQKSVANTLVPQIYAEMGVENTVSEVRTYQGVAAVQSFFMKMLKQMSRESTFDIMGAGGEAFMSRIGRPGMYLERFDTLRNEKSIAQRQLMYENQRDVDPVYTQRRHVETKYLPEQFHQPTATHIWPDRISILFFDEEPHVIEIKSAKMAVSFRNYFEMLWKISKQ